MTTFLSFAPRTLLLSGIAMVSSWTAGGTVQAQTFLLDFGAAANNFTTTTGPSPDDPVNFWNNVPEAIGASPTLGGLFDLVTKTNEVSDIDLLMLSRFNGSNLNGTQASSLYPIDATRDSLFGNTEVFGGQTLSSPPSIRQKLTTLSFTLPAPGSLTTVRPYIASRELFPVQSLSTPPTT